MPLFFGLTAHTQNNNVVVTVNQLRDIRLTYVELQNTKTDLVYCEEENLLLKDKLNLMDSINYNITSQYGLINNNYNELLGVFQQDQTYIKQLQKSLDRQNTKMKWLGGIQGVVLIGIITLIFIQ